MFFPVLLFPVLSVQLKVFSVLLVEDERIYLATAPDSDKYPLELSLLVNLQSILTFPNNRNSN